jgi:hypothetical protein
MKANVGDWLVLKGRTHKQAEQRGMITEPHAADGSPPYLVRWLDTEHEALVFPGPDAVIVTPAEQQAADARARSRFAAVQAAITNHPADAVKPADAHYDEIRPLTFSERRQLAR